MEPFEASQTDQKEREAKFREEWGNDLLYKTTGSILMKPRKGIKRFFVNDFVNLIYDTI